MLKGWLIKQKGELVAPLGAQSSSLIFPSILEFRGKDLPPSSDMHFQSLPKGAMRILHGAKIQAEYREKKKQREVEAAKKKKNAANTGQLQIGDGEKMGDFNR